VWHNGHGLFFGGKGARVGCLFLLTGNIQIGKSRWLEGVVADLVQRGTLCAGVLAPGVWRKRTAAELRAIEQGSVDFELPQFSLGTRGPFEKLGINNVLLPQGTVVPFATRCDMATHEFTVPNVSLAPTSTVENSPADVVGAAGGAGVGVVPTGGAVSAGAAGAAGAPMKFGWTFDGRAIERVNRHFDELAAEWARSARLRHFDKPRLLVVDELGRLELLCGAGLVSAVKFLQSPALFEPDACALCVVRESLLPAAHEMFAPYWDKILEIGPDDSGKNALLSALK
jgi:hypothetical protein